MFCSSYCNDKRVFNFVGFVANDACSSFARIIVNVEHWIL